MCGGGQILCHLNVFKNHKLKLPVPVPYTLRGLILLRDIGGLSYRDFRSCGVEARRARTMIGNTQDDSIPWARAV